MFYDAKTETGSHILLNSVQTLWSQLVVFKADNFLKNLICVVFGPKVSLEKLVLWGCEGNAICKGDFELNPVRCRAFVTPIKIRRFFWVRLAFIMSAFTLHEGFNQISFGSVVSRDSLNFSRTAPCPLAAWRGYSASTWSGVVSPVPGVTLMYPDRKPTQKSTWTYLYLCRETKPIQMQECFTDLGHTLFVRGN